MESTHRTDIRFAGGFMKRLGSILLFVLVFSLALMFSMPLLWTLMSSLKNYSEIIAFPPTILPKQPVWDNYVFIFVDVPFLLFIYNTLHIAVLSVLGSTISAAIVGYSFSRFRWPGRDIMFMLCLASMMLPREVTLIPTYVLYSKIKWIDTWRPLIVPHFLDRKSVV